MSPLNILGDLIHCNSNVFFFITIQSKKIDVMQVTSILTWQVANDVFFKINIQFVSFIIAIKTEKQRGFHTVWATRKGHC